MMGDWRLTEPDKEKIVCRDCVWREADRMDGHICGATLAICKCYDKGKPHKVLWNYEKCVYYLKEDLGRR